MPFRIVRLSEITGSMVSWIFAAIFKSDVDVHGRIYVIAIL